MSDTDTRHKSFLERQRDAALEQIREQQNEFSRVADIVLPRRNAALRRDSRYVTDVIKLGDNDFIVQVVDRRKGASDEVTWTTVVDGKSSIHYFHMQDEAVLHLLARRHDSSDTGSAAAVVFACRVLGVRAAAS